MEKKFGYVRVSTKEQNTARQEELMKSLGVDEVYIDRLSGKDNDRPALRDMMKCAREGCTDPGLPEPTDQHARC